MSAQQRPVLSVVLVNLEGFFCVLCDNCLIPEASRGEAATVSVSTFAGSPFSLSESSLGPWSGNLEFWIWKHFSHLWQSSGNHTKQITLGDAGDLTSNRPTVNQALLLYLRRMSQENKRGTEV